MRTFSVLALLLVAAFPANAVAQTQRAQTPIITVTGQGTISRAPDQATLALQIVTNNDVAATATSQNNTVYNALRSRLASIGIAESALHTRGFNVNFVPKPTDATSFKPPRTGYVVTRSLDVTLNDLTAVGRAIDGAVAAGVSDIGGVSYGFKDRRAVYAEALAAAVRDAGTQANAIATAAGLRLGPIRAINAGGSVVPRQPVLMGRAMAANAAPVPTEIQPSDIDVSASVTVTYDLVR